MTGSCRHVGILLQDCTDSFKRSERRIRNGISHTVVRTSPATFRPHKIIFSLALQHKRTFYVVFRSHFLIDGTILKRHDTQQIRSHLHHITMAPATIIHIILAIIILEHKLVDRLGTIHNFINQRFSQCILKRSCGIVGYSNTYSA